MNDLFFQIYTVAYKVKRYLRLWKDALCNAWLSVHLSAEYDELYFAEHIKQRSNSLPKQYWHIKNLTDYYLFLIKYSNSQYLKRKINKSTGEYQLSDKYLLALIAYCESELVNLSQRHNLFDEIDVTYKTKIANCQRMAEKIRQAISLESKSDSENSN